MYSKHSWKSWISGELEKTWGEFRFNVYGIVIVSVINRSTINSFFINVLKGYRMNISIKLHTP